MIRSKTNEGQRIGSGLEWEGCSQRRTPKVAVSRDLDEAKEPGMPSAEGGVFQADTTVRTGL